MAPLFDRDRQALDAEHIMKIENENSTSDVESKLLSESKLPYLTPVLKSYGAIVDVVRSQDNVGDDGTGGFPTDSGS